MSWNRVKTICGNRCVASDARGPVTRDHVFPRSRGGTLHPANVQPLCQRCNLLKGASTTDFRTAAQIDAIVAEFGRPKLVIRHVPRRKAKKLMRIAVDAPSRMPSRPLGSSLYADPMVVFKGNLPEWYR